MFEDGAADDIAEVVCGPCEGAAACCRGDEGVSKVGVVAVVVAELEGDQLGWSNE